MDDAHFEEVLHAAEHLDQQEPNRILAQLVCFCVHVRIVVSARTRADAGNTA